MLFFCETRQGVDFRSGFCDIVWQKIIAGPDDEVAYSVDTTDDGGLIMAGYQDNTTMSWNIYVIKTDSAGNL